MRKFCRLCLGEYYKYRHTVIYPVHIFIPVAGSLILLWYNQSSVFSEKMQIGLFLQVTGSAYPFLVSLICSGSVGLEEKNHFQIILSGSVNKLSALLAKCTALQLAGLGAVFLGVGVFVGGEIAVLGNGKFSIAAYLYAALGLWLGSFLLYPVHLFFSLKFSKAISLGVGIAQSLVAALLLTGLGEGIWWFFPGSWSVRLSQQFFLGTADCKKGICLLITLLVYVIIFLWFYRYEGRQCDD